VRAVASVLVDFSSERNDSTRLSFIRASEIVGDVTDERNVYEGSSKEDRSN
jgi:hypothetical protein